MIHHTPGPWHHETRGFRDLTGPTFDIYPPADMATGSRMPVAQTVTSEANARLIAAAPDLLRALRMMLREHDALQIADGKTDDRWPAAGLARAAIFSATGE